MKMTELVSRIIWQSEGRHHCCSKYTAVATSFFGAGIYMHFYIETGNACFPSDDWNGFPQTVLDWWIKELKSVWIGSERNTYGFRFMDGPYSVHCSKEKDQLRLSYYEDNIKVLPDTLTCMKEMKSGIQSVLETLLRCLYLEGHSECISAVAESKLSAFCDSRL